ncbi:hypothetical protein EmuJ_001084000 [Echinococcus multilocularis]|uniref:Uncharacterized protein n=1 Tax=Echinococcus multilocularis TaxID=6211 RepID=A0A068YEC0_ECHMU|nr:hypothetical protein EmuJ_001084000 [Echinococcus multilocularis]
MMRHPIPTSDVVLQGDSSAAPLLSLDHLQVTCKGPDHAFCNIRITVSSKSERNRYFGRLICMGIYLTQNYPVGVAAAIVRAYTAENYFETPPPVIPCHCYCYYYAMLRLRQ